MEFIYNNSKYPFNLWLKQIEFWQGNSLKNRHKKIRTSLRKLNGKYR